MKNKFINKNNIEAEQARKGLNNQNLLLDHLPALPELEKMFLKLFLKQNKTFIEIAGTLNITKAQVRQLKQMALIRLRIN